MLQIINNSTVFVFHCNQKVIMIRDGPDIRLIYIFGIRLNVEFHVRRSGSLLPEKRYPAKYKILARYLVSGRISNSLFGLCRISGPSVSLMRCLSERNIASSSSLHLRRVHVLHSRILSSPYVLQYYIYLYIIFFFCTETIFARFVRACISDYSYMDIHLQSVVQLCSTRHNR